MNKRLTVLMVAMISAVIAGCSGGGGTSTPTSITPLPVATPAPTVTLSLSASKVTLGKSATVTWSSTNATSCTASGAWTGTQAISGASLQTPSASGANAYTLTCIGAGGSANQTATLTVPIPVQPSSYENKAVAGESLGAQKLPNGVNWAHPLAFADFFQDGSYSMVTHSLEYRWQDVSTANQVGHIYFWKSVNGSWIDNTSKVLADNSGCVHPRQAIVADFNGDGLPDVFFACHGFDGPPWPGDSPHILLSQAEGTYKKTILPFKCFCHGAAAADVNGDGYPDILVVGDFIGEKTPFFLINNKDGTFTKDLTRLPSDAKGKPIFSTELIDFGRTGKYDVFLGGHEQQPANAWPATILPNDGTGRFASTARVLLPSAQGYGFPLDLVYAPGAIYLARTIDSSANFYGGAAIQKITYPSLASQILYEHSGAYRSGTSWINWIIVHGGTVTTLDVAYGISIPR